MAGAAGSGLVVSESDLPLAGWREGAVLALIIGTEGPSYRRVGAGMVILPDRTRLGYISAGCIDHDIALHAADAAQAQRPRQLRYGRGSPFRDLELPCGGGLDILLVPGLATADIGRARRDLVARIPVQLDLPTPAGLPLPVTILPQLRFLVMGKGPEAVTFANMAAATNYDVALYSPDPETLAAAVCHRNLLGSKWPEAALPDARSAVTLFFHDHDRETVLLRTALQSQAFYIGAMGSQRAAHARHNALLAAGVNPESIARLAQPFGLVPSARNPRSLAISVMADVLGRAVYD